MKWVVEYWAPGVVPGARHKKVFARQADARHRAVELARAGYRVEVYPVHGKWRGTALRLEPRPV